MLGNVRVFAFNALPSNPDRSGSCANASYAGDDIASAIDRGVVVAPTRAPIVVLRVVNATRRVDDADAVVLFFVVTTAPRIIECVAMVPVVVMVAYVRSRASRAFRAVRARVKLTTTPSTSTRLNVFG
jgi:hypothetical protein